MHETILLYDLPIADVVEDETTSETSTEITTEITTQGDIEYITTEGQIVDTRLYLSTNVVNATNNDIYSMLLSIRNILVLFFLILLFFKVKTSIHNVLAKYFENRR